MIPVNRSWGLGILGPEGAGHVWGGCGPDLGGAPIDKGIAKPAPVWDKRPGEWLDSLETGDKGVDRRFPGGQGAGWQTAWGQGNWKWQ